MKLVPITFVHMCCSRGYVFGQAANGDCYRRQADAPGSQEWEPVVPALGAALRRRVSTETETRRKRRRR